MTKKDQKFVSLWTSKIESGSLNYYLKTTMLTCLCSLVVILFYTWNNIPENKLIESLMPLSVLIFGFGIPLGLIFSWQTWTRNNNRYKFLTKDGEFPQNAKKRKWFDHDKIWDSGIRVLGAVFFLLFYTSIFLFDSGEPTLLKYSIVGVILSYFVAQIGYAIYRYIVDKRGETKRFPMFFKCIFIAIILLTLILWVVLFYGG
ncbi:MAG: hypothetical protein ABI371_00180 [Gelidibacter sp.]